MRAPRAWFRVEAKAGEDVAHLYIFDAIGQSYWSDNAVSATSFIAALTALPTKTKTIHVHVNSPGGDVFDGTAIANALRAQRDQHGRTVEVTIEGLAASAASVVIMAGTPIHIADNALVMIHDPYMITIGDAADHRASAEALDKIRDTIVATYRWHSTRSEAELRAMMAAETWMNADEAIAHGFATEKIEGLAAAASISRRGMDRAKVPAQYRDRVNAWLAPKETPVPAPAAASASDVLRECKANGCGVDLADELIAAGATLEQVKARTSAAKTARDQAAARATEITAICANSHMPELAASLIASDMTPGVVKDLIVVVKAKASGQVHIDGTLLPPKGRATATRDALADAYGKLNGVIR